MSGLTLGSIVATIVILIEVIGVISAVYAILASRTPQGAIAWGIALISMPLIAVPLYLVLGRSKFHGIVSARRAGAQHLLESLEEALRLGESSDPAEFRLYHVLQRRLFLLFPFGRHLWPVNVTDRATLRRAHTKQRNGAMLRLHPVF